MADDIKINAELVLYRINKIELMVSDHNKIHETHMENILQLFKDMPNQYASKQTERNVNRVAWLMISTLIIAVLALVVNPQMALAINLFAQIPIIRYIF